MKTIRVLIWIVMCICLILTFMPYLNVFNAPVMIAGLPMPLALTLGCNLILTLCVIALYPLYFKPFMKALKNKPISEEKYNG
jgi:membrane protein implicated in regulation of membrane protease activity